ncbi:MAG TPA: hypothetical protein VKA64_05230 [Gammaproteobacteria bacterium]|nr:hypothetical protein [Gammaproteobacteria bacterium]
MIGICGEQPDALAAEAAAAFLEPLRTLAVAEPAALPGAGA